MKNLLLLIPITLLLMACGKNNDNTSFPDRLIGVEIRYTYSGGNEYAVKFEDDGLRYQYRSGRTPEVWFGPFEYNYMTTESNEHLVSWHEPKKGDYVTLLINFEKNLLYGSAIIGKKKVHFQTGEIHEVKKP